MLGNDTSDIWDTETWLGMRLRVLWSPRENRGEGAEGGAGDNLGLGPRELPKALSASLPTHGATTGEQVDYVVVERCHVVGNEDPDALIPEPRVLLPGHEPQHCTHGPHHEPGDAGSSDCTASGRAEPGPDPPRAPGRNLRRTLSGSAQLTRKTWIPRNRRRTRRQNPTGA